MMNIRTMIRFLALMLLFISFGLQAQVRVSRIDGSFAMGNQGGIVYALPQTMITVDVVVERKEHFAGPLRNYAEKYMGISNFIREDDIVYNIADVSLNPVPVPDPEHHYFIAPDEKSSRQNWQSILRLNGAGMITSVAGIPAEKAGGNAIGNLTGPDEISEIFRMDAGYNMYPKIDTIVRRISIDTMIVRDLSFRTSMQQKPLEEKARETAVMIGRIREDRYNLLIGFQEVNYSGEALRYMDEGLQKLEEEYLRLFTGAVVTSHIHYRFNWLPASGQEGKNITLFRISQSSGIMDGGSGGEPVMIRVDLDGSTGMLKDAGKNASLLPAAAGHGICYRIPETGTVTVSFRGSSVASLHLPLSQFGMVSSLPVNAGNVEFDGNTGGLNSLRLDNP